MKNALTLAVTFFACSVLAQNAARPAFLDPPSAQPAPKQELKRIRPNAPPADYVRVYGVEQTREGKLVHLRGRAEVESADMIIQADEIDFNEESGDAEARGNVRFEHFARGEKIQATRIEYNVDAQTGKFYDVIGTSPAKIDARPGILTTTNPFYFQGKWAERIEGKYLLYDGLVTDCRMPGGWWTLRAPKFDVIPGDRAIAYKALYWFKGVPIFYGPVMYKSLKRMPRKSGFLTPNIGNSSTRGKMVGWGYYWAINRSYDVAYNQQYFTIRGFAHHVEFRGKPNDRTDFDAIVYGVNDKGIQVGDTIQKQGGWLSYINARTYLGNGWEGRAQVNYLSSFEFRQAFTESFTEAVTSQSHSTGYVTKHWSSFGFYGLADVDTNFQSTADNDRVTIRKLPEAQFFVRERPVLEKFPLPIYVSVESRGGFLRRAEPTFETGQFVERADFAPTVRTAFSFKGFSLSPSFGIRETGWGASTASNGSFTTTNVARHARDFELEFYAPPLARVFKAPKWTRAEKLKHVIETRAVYRNTSGINDFHNTVLFDEVEMMSNTNELEVSLTNRFYTKSATGNTKEVLSWEILQKRYFDPTFGGALIPGQRNLLQSEAEITGFAFLTEPRNYSPVVSIVRINTPVTIDWRADYDPLDGNVANSGITADFRRPKYWISAGHNQVKYDPGIGSNTNQFRGMVGIGNENRRGWMMGFSGYYDYKLRLLRYATTQVTYNTDCCGFSVQYRRFSVPSRNENQFRVAFVIANIGSFGTLKRQERMF